MALFTLGVLHMSTRADSRGLSPQMLCSHKHACPCMFPMHVWIVRHIIAPRHRASAALAYTSHRICTFLNPKQTKPPFTNNFIYSKALSQLHSVKVQVRRSPCSLCLQLVVVVAPSR